MPPGIIRLRAPQADAVASFVALVTRSADAPEFDGGCFYGPFDWRIMPPAVLFDPRAVQGQTLEMLISRFAPSEVRAAGPRGGDPSALSKWVAACLRELDLPAEQPSRIDCVVDGLRAVLTATAATGVPALVVDARADAFATSAPIQAFLREHPHLTLLVPDTDGTQPEGDFDAVIDIPPPDPEPTPLPPPWFRWVIPGSWAGMPRPGSSVSVEETFDELERRGVRAVLCLEETETSRAACEARGLAWRHLPIVDMEVPEFEAAEATIAELESFSGSTAVHCKAGIGRTGTLLAAVLFRQGYRYADAMTLLRQINPHYVQSDAQRAWLREQAPQ